MATARRRRHDPGGAAWGFRTEDELRSSGAREVIAHPLELLEFLDNGGAPVMRFSAYGDRGLRLRRDRCRGRRSASSSRGLVTIRVDARRASGEMRPAWRFFGYDEPNYTYMKDGKELLSRARGPGPRTVFIARTTC